MSERPAHRAAESTFVPTGFRAQDRFIDPAAAPPPEWTAPTPPKGLPLPPAPPPEQQQHQDPPPYLDLSTVALLGQRKRAPSEGWRKWLYLASFKLINVGEGAKATRRQMLVAQVQ
ncbi:MAG: MinD/ParA family protein, partial [Actinomycetota bacterium]|nr:MinD/ParA family protein [Actinomycetota bacterium]